jgi:TolB-like protein/predicted Zn-dependent protease
MENAPNTSWWGNLWERKVPQYLSSYLAIGFGLLQFLEFLVNRYALAPSLIDKYLLLWLVSVPAIAVLVYYGGRIPGTWQKIFVPLNLAGATLLSLLLFNGVSRATAQTVSVTTETGDTIQSVVPSLEMVKNVAIFQLANETDDPELDWWGIAFSDVLSFDLRQRPEFYPLPAYSLISYYDYFGVELFDIPNLATQRKIAQRVRSNYFLRGSYRKVPEGYQVTGALHRTRDGKELFAIDEVGTDLFSAVDAVNARIINNIPNPLQTVEQQSDLPAAALLSDNTAAVRALTRGQVRFYRAPTDLEPALALLQESVAADPNCAECQFQVADKLYGLGRTEEATAGLRKTAQLARTLPDRLQFRYKLTLYTVTGETEKAIRLQEVRRKLFPFEYEAYSSLASYYQTNYGVDSAIAVIQEAIEYGNLEKGLLRLYQLYVEKEDFAAAENTLDRYFQEFPDQTNDRWRYADLYEKQNRFDAAREVLIEQNALDPFNSETLLRLAYLEHRFGNYRTADSLIGVIEGQATSLVDSLSAIRARVQFTANQGQVATAMRLNDLLEKESARRAPINRILMSGFPFKAQQYLLTGNTTILDSLQRDIATYSPEYTQLMDCYVKTIQITYDLPNDISPEELEICNAAYTAYGPAYQDYIKILGHYSRGEFADAAALVELAYERGQTSVSQQPFLVAKIMRKAGNAERAEEVLQQKIRSNEAEPIYYLELARIQRESDPAAARASLAKALEAWQNADPGYIPAQRAQALAEELALVE